LSISYAVNGAGDDRNRRREQRGWMFYDWANSAYATTVAAVFLGPTLDAMAKQAACAQRGLQGAACEAAEDVPLAFLGVTLSYDSWFPYVLGLSILVQIVVLPITGAVADRSRHKTQILALFAYIGAVATMLMYFVADGRFLLGWVLYLIANMAFGASIVVYNAFLPEISTQDERDKVSAQGWALGYLGGGLLLGANLALFGVHESLGLSAGHAVRISLLSAGAWWALFTLIPLSRLRNRREAALLSGVRVVSAGFHQLRDTLRGARAYPRTLLFLAAYLFYNDGIQSVILLTAVYAVNELKFEQSTIIVAILMAQFVAFVGALVLGRLARLFGAKRMVLGSLVLWTLVVATAYFLEERATIQFFALAALIGFVLGGSQALSRSLYSQMIPRGEEAEYFSLYEISERGTSWLGAVTFATVNQLTGSYRAAILSLVAFFVVGFGLLAAVNVRRAIAEVGNPQPERV
jgi:UMF1 family MFS transporter